MRAPWFTWVWPIIILLSTLAVTLITFLFPGVGIRPAVIMCFLFLIPGMTIVRFFYIGETAVEWMFAIVLSFTIDAFVAGVILYAGQWSPTHIMSFLIGFCFSGAIAQLVIIRPTPSGAEPVPPIIKYTEMRINTEGTEVRFDPERVEDPEDTKDIETRFGPEGVEGLEMRIDIENIDTKALPAASLPSHQSFQEDTQEKTVPLEKSELSGKEA
jgi:hypothetical protein